MGVFNVHDAKTHLSRLLDRVAQGEEIIIAKSGRPVAKLVGSSRMVLSCSIDCILPEHG